MQDDARTQLMRLDALTGTWTTEGTHPLLPDAVVRGRATFEWLGDRGFQVWRSHSDHPEIPDALAVTGVTDGRLSMHYFDSRGVHRLYSVAVDEGTWRFWRTAADLSQRATGIVGADTVTVRGELSSDGTSWEDDLALTFRRTAGT